ncbi:interleukin-1 receptor-like 1 [Sphaeramia orbicularis]|uniref:interleukin-1 receptor-like 1 n=1 Tax=Sphaeramia orbicularis TaxID=375764 RepID=UPI00117DA961|nr:interleukin-1 receptor-like 1 [Sphaeramia orbicularis]
MIIIIIFFIYRNDRSPILNGAVTWYKLENFTLLPNETQYELWIPKATKKDEGVYVCVCTWTHNHLQYTSTAARGLLVPEPYACRDLKIFSPFVKEQFVYEGSRISLNCSVLCGIKKHCGCKAHWEAKGTLIKKMSTFHRTFNITTEDLSQNVIATETLTIERVSPEDFVEFRCVGERLFESTSYTVTLKRRESMIPLVIAGVCVFSLCVFAAVIVKCFAIDLALIFRRYLPFRRAENSAMTFDAYVVYQLQSEDKDTEDTLCHFVTKVLPEVLEEKCGYRLFIHGRDDIPGEDRLELVEDRMKKSRRLIVILTPGSGSGSEVKEQNLQQPVMGGFDWQVGLHHALVQREMTVILIQLGDTGPQGYTHLPPGLQHLIQKSDPLRWPQNSRGAASSNSRFWKRVRYLMPATPAKKCPQSDII